MWSNQLIEMRMTMLAVCFSVFLFLFFQKLCELNERWCFFFFPVGPVYVMIYTLLNFHVCFIPPLSSASPLSLPHVLSVFLSRFLGSRQAWPARTVQGNSCLSFLSSPPSALHSMESWSRYLHTGKCPALAILLEVWMNIEAEILNWNYYI